MQLYRKVVNRTLWLGCARLYLVIIVIIYSNYVIFCIKWPYSHFRIPKHHQIVYYIFVCSANSYSSDFHTHTHTYTFFFEYCNTVTSAKIVYCPIIHKSRTVTVFVFLYPVLQKKNGIKKETKAFLLRLCWLQGIVSAARAEIMTVIFYIMCFQHLSTNIFVYHFKAAGN